MLHLDPADRCTATVAIGHEFVADYLENNQSQSLRWQFVYDWGMMEDVAQMYCQSREAERTRKKRLAVALWVICDRAKCHVRMNPILQTFECEIFEIRVDRKMLRMVVVVFGCNNQRKRSGATGLSSNCPS